MSEMHELSIAAAIVQIAEKHATAQVPAGVPAPRVTRVNLQVGHLRQVVPTALSFSFELVAQGTPVEGAQLDLEMIPTRGLCRSCGAETTLHQFPLQCGTCSGLDLQIIAGEELLVESLEFEEVQHGVYS